MQINKTDFKVILNHMKSLSQLENNNLINQTRNGKTDYNDINQLINIYSSKKISKLMDKINNNFLTFGGRQSKITKSKSKLTFAKLKTHINENAKNKFDNVKNKIKDIIKSKGNGEGEDEGDNDGDDDYDDDDDYDGNINKKQRQELIKCIDKLIVYIESLQSN
jgi:hypothetical protein